MKYCLIINLQGESPKAMNLIKVMRAKLAPNTPGYSVSSNKMSCDICYHSYHACIVCPQVLCACHLELQLRQLLLCNNLSKLCNHSRSLVEDLAVYDSAAAQYW